MQPIDDRPCESIVRSFTVFITICHCDFRFPSLMIAFIYLAVLYQLLISCVVAAAAAVLRQQLLLIHLDQWGYNPILSI